MRLFHSMTRSCNERDIKTSKKPGENKFLPNSDRVHVEVGMELLSSGSLIHKGEGGTTTGRVTCLIWQIFKPDALLDAIPKGLVSLPRIETSIFQFLDDL